jgi:hypothetical protein
VTLFQPIHCEAGNDLNIFIVCSVVKKNMRGRDVPPHYVTFRSRKSAMKPQFHRGKGLETDSDTSAEVILGHSIADSRNSFDRPPRLEKAGAVTH